jgi:hypothetical protein
MKYVINVSPETEEMISRLVELGICRDIYEFIDVAIQNQLRWEYSSLEEPLEAGMTSLSKHIGHTSFEMLRIPPSAVKTIQPPINVEKGPLWGQYYRFLPLKVVLRVIANMSIISLPSVDEVTENCILVATEIGERLRKADREMANKKGKKISIVFPRKDQKSVEKSRKRFISQYLGYIQSGKGVLKGMGAALLFMNMANGRIGLTSSGLRFASLENPVIDKSDYRYSISNEEADFLIDHLMENVPDEAEHVSWLLHGLKEGLSSREQINNHMRRFYAKYEINGHWTDKMIETMRAGLVSRLSELGFIEVFYSGKNASYILTERGNIIIDKLDKKIKPVHSSVNGGLSTNG